MSALSPILRNVIDGNGERLLSFWCPGCEGSHIVTIERDTRPCWGWNGSVDAPTFTPSILVTYNGDDAGVDDAPPATCHSFVTDGQIQFLGDCTHALAGQTVPIPLWPDDYHDGDTP